MRQGWKNAVRALALVAAAFGPTSGKSMAESDGERVFGLVERLAEARPFTVAGVAAALNLTAAPARDREGNWFRYVTFAAIPAASPFAEVEVRQRLAVEPGRDGLVILTLRAEACIDEWQVTRHFGADPVFSPPPPHAPADEPKYFSYPQAWGELRFGFAPAREDCLETVVLDATGG